MRLSTAALLKPVTGRSPGKFTKSDSLCHKRDRLKQRRHEMKETRLTLPQLWLIAATRAALGGGMALLFVDRLTDRQRKAAGWALFLAGVVSTIPLGRLVLDKRR